MKERSFVARTLLIRENEWELVKRLFAFEFFQGISIAIFFYSSITIFLTYLPTEELAYAFILSAFLLWLAGAVYSRLEHRIDTKELILLVVGINATMILLCRFGLMLNEPTWFYFLMLGAFNVAYLLNNLEFWGSAALLFDVRQSKRLFSIISAGDIPAKLVGYVASAFLAKLLGQDNLLWIAFGSLVVSLYFFRQLAATGALNPQHHKHHEATNPLANTALQIFRSNTLIRQAAFISFFSYCAFILLNFLFFGYIKEASHSKNESLAIYIGVFLALSRAITLVVKLAVTNRLADRMGVRNSLLITPILVFILCLVALPATMNQSIIVIFYMFTTITISLDVLRAAIQSPVLLAAMQPLPVGERLSGHTIIKGITDPFAFFFVGGILALALAIRPDVDYRVMSILLFILVIAWIISVLRFDRVYISTVQRAIRNRSVQEREISISDRESLDILRKKISSGSPGDAAFAFRLIKDQPKEVQQEFLKAGMNHPSAYVQREAILFMREWNVSSLLPSLKEFVSHATGQDVLVDAVNVLATMDEAFDYNRFLEHPNPDVVMMTLTRALKTNEVASVKANNILRAWCESSDPSFRLRAAKVIGSVENHEYRQLLVQLMHDSNSQISSAAISSAGMLKDSILNDQLIKLLSAHPKQSVVIDALHMAGNSAVHAISSFVDTTDNDDQRKKMILLLGKIGTEEAKAALDHLTDELPASRGTIFKALTNCGFTADPSPKSKYQKFVREYLSSAAHLAFVIQYLEQQKIDKELIHAFEEELQSLREKLLQLFGFLYDRKSIRKAIAGFDLHTRDSLSNALEIIAVTVSRDAAKTFICLFEPSTYEQKCADLSASHGEPHLSKTIVSDEVLRDQHHQYHSWTKACVMYFMKNDIRRSEKPVVEPFKFSRNPLLQQTAEWLLNSNPKLT